MPFISQPGNVDIYYEVQGTGDPLLLSHGYSATSEMWTGQIHALSERYQLIVWDMRGHGKSSYPEDPSLYSEAHTVHDMEAILSKVCGKRKTIIGGLSLGGYMSLAFYGAHPERVSRLLIIDTGPGFKSDKARNAWNKTALHTADTYEKRGLQTAQDESVERTRFHHRNAKGLVLAAKGMLTQRNDAVIKVLPTILVPTLIVVGQQDTPFLAAADYMTAKIPNVEKVVIPNAGHTANIDQPDLFNTAILRFLKTHEEKASRL